MDPMTPEVMTVVERLAAEVRVGSKGLKRWRWGFELARRLRAVVPADTDPATLASAAVALGRLLDANPVDVATALEEAWPIVQKAKGDDRFAEAAALAARSQVDITPDPGSLFRPVARLCFHLSELAAGEPFAVPTVRVAEFMGVSHVTAGKVLRLLVRRGVIAWANPEWSYRSRQARTAKFVGTATPMAATAAV